jgi:hypothetical protein
MSPTAIDIRNTGARIGINYDPTTRVGIGTTPGSAPINILGGLVVKPLSDDDAGIVVEITDANYAASTHANYGTFPIMVLDKHTSETILGNAIRFYVTANGDIQGQGWQHLAVGQADATMRGATLPNQAQWIQPAIDIAGHVITQPAAGTKDLIYISNNGGSTTYFAVGSTGQARHAVGSVGAPTITFDGDLDTGVYHPAANVVGLAAGGSLGAQVTSNLTTVAPATSVMVSLGSYFGLPGCAFGNPADAAVYRSAAGIVGVTSALELTEMAAPAAGGVNTARLYAQDNGAGKTQLMVKFNTGAAIQLAIQA